MFNKSKTNRLILYRVPQMTATLTKNGLMNDARYLTLKGQVFYKEKKAGKITSAQIGSKTGYTPEYVRMLLNGIVRVTERNIQILDVIENIAMEFHNN